MVPESWNIVGGVWPRTHDGPDVCSRTRFQSDPEDEAGPSKRPCQLERQIFRNLPPRSRDASTTEHLQMNQANEIKVSDLTGAKLYSPVSQRWSPDVSDGGHVTQGSWSGSGLSGGLESVAHAGLGDEVARCARFGF